MDKIWQTAAAIVASPGGIGAFFLMLVKLGAKYISDSLLEGEKAKYAAELAALKATFDRELAGINKGYTEELDQSGMLSRLSSKASRQSTPSSWKEQRESLTRPATQ